MENKNIIWRNSMNYGAILGLALILLSVIGYILNVQQSSILGILNYLILAVIVFMGSKTLRDKYSGGYMKYGRAFGSSFLIGLFGGIVLSLYTYIFMKYIDPSFLEQIKILTEQKLIEQGLPGSQIDMSLRMISPGIITIGTVFSFAFWSVLLSLILAFFVRKENNNPTMINQESAD